MNTPELIQAIVSGDYNENDVIQRCKYEPSLTALFKSLLQAASTMAATKGVQGGFMWSMSERRFDFDNPKDMRLYTDVEFVRLQNAMAIVCDHIERQEQECTEPQHGKEKAIEQYITGSNKGTTIQAIKSLVCGKKGKQAAVIIAVAVADGYMCKATFDILKTAFCIDGTKQAFNNAYKLYTDNGSTRQTELSAARAALKRAIEGAG